MMVGDLPERKRKLTIAKSSFEEMTMAWSHARLRSVGTPHVSVAQMVVHRIFNPVVESSILSGDTTPIARRGSVRS